MVSFNYGKHSKKRIGSIDELDRKNIICIVFSDIIGELGGSLRVDSYGENSNLIEIESE